MKPTKAQLLSPDDELPKDATDFERAHHYGSRRHSALWMAANQAAIDVAHINDINPTSPEIKTLLSQVVLRVLDVAATGKTGRI